MTKRLFIAIPFPADIITALHALQHGITKARWLPEQQLHLTLRFLGDVDETSFEPLQEELGRIQLPPFSLAVAGTGAFPPRGLPRVLWAGLSPSPPLLSLARQVEEQVVAAGFPREHRPYSPHITLGRLTSANPAEVRHYLEEHRSFALPSFAVERFILYGSRLTPKGAIHTPLSSHSLAADAVSTPSSSDP